MSEQDPGYRPVEALLPKKVLALAAAVLVIVGACQVMQDGDNERRTKRDIPEQLADYESCVARSTDPILIMRSEDVGHGDEEDGPEESPAVGGVGLTHTIKPGESLGGIANCCFSDPELGLASGTESERIISAGGITTKLRIIGGELEFYHQ